MALDLSQAKAAIFVFAQSHCPACHEFTPVFFKRVAARVNQGFAPCDGTCPIRPGQIPVFHLDVGSDDPQIRELIDRYGITLTPTTLLLLRGPGSCKLEGTLTDVQIEQVLDAAVAG